MCVPHRSGKGVSQGGADDDERLIVMAWSSSQSRTGTSADREPELSSYGSDDYVLDKLREPCVAAKPRSQRELRSPVQPRRLPSASSNHVLMAGAVVLPVSVAMPSAARLYVCVECFLRACVCRFCIGVGCGRH